MTQKVTSLTQAQIDSMATFRDMWLDIGLDTGRINHERAIAALNLSYEKAGLKPPRFVLFAEGPSEAMKFLSITDKVQLTEEDFVALMAKSPTALTEAIRTILSLEKTVKTNVQWPSFYGQHEAGWLGFNDFFAHHFGLSELSEGLRNLAKEAGWVWMYEDLAIISQRPIRVTMDAQGRIHNEKKAAIEYADGTSVYAFNGVVLPEKWVLERDTMDPSEIFAESDTDKRAAGIALFGYARLKDRLNYKVLEGDPTTDIGALIEIELPGLNAKGRFLEAICPRNGPVFLGIPRNNPWDNDKAINTAVGAQAFLARLPESAYQHPPIRT